MSLGLYMDVHVPLPITRGLRRRGVDMLTAQDDNTQRLPDPQLLDRATSLGRLLFSEDSDLVAEFQASPPLSGPVIHFVKKSFFHPPGRRRYNACNEDSPGRQDTLGPFS